MARSASWTRRGWSAARDEGQAVEELGEAIYDPSAALTLVFASAAHDPARLAPALAKAFPGLLMIGCTTAGELNAGGYVKGTLTGTSLSGPEVRAARYVVDDLPSFGPRQADDLCARILADKERFEAELPGAQAFVLVLIDGLSVMEELVVGYVGPGLGDLPLIGGSAGDDLQYRRTCIFDGGRIHSSAAVFALVVTRHPFAPLATQHFHPTDKKLVITGAVPQQRLVTEIDGEPAAEAYARLVGVPVPDLGPAVFSRHPVMLRLGGQNYVRSILEADPKDGVLRFHSAVDEGLVLTLGEGGDILHNLGQCFEAARRQVPHPELVIGFECILRRLELEQKGLVDEAATLMRAHEVVGFHTYGEQFGALHMNQTFTGLMLGR